MSLLAGKFALTRYTFDPATAPSAEDLRTNVSHRAFVPTTATQPVSSGWVDWLNPLGSAPIDPLVGSRVVLKYRSDTRSVPPAVIERVTRERLAQHEEVGRAFRKAVKESVRVELLAQATPRTKLTDVVLDFATGRIYIAGRGKSADDAAGIIARTLKTQIDLVRGGGRDFLTWLAFATLGEGIAMVEGVDAAIAGKIVLTDDVTKAALSGPGIVSTALPEVVHAVRRLALVSEMAIALADGDHLNYQANMHDDGSFSGVTLPEIMPDEPPKLLDDAAQTPTKRAKIPVDTLLDLRIDMLDRLHETERRLVDGWSVLWEDETTRNAEAAKMRDIIRNTIENVPQVEAMTVEVDHG